MKKLSVSLALLTLSASSLGFAEPLKLDAAHSTVGFKIKHLVISTVNGRFNKFEGSAEFDEKTGKVENLKVKIDVASIDTNEPKRDQHLRSKDFFDIEKFPEIEFIGRKATYKNNKPVQIAGDLTIHGVTKPTTLSLEFKGIVTDPWETRRGAFEASGTINRKDFGLTWNKSLDAGGVMIADEVKLVIEGEAIVSGK